MKKTPRQLAKINGFADGLHGYPCNTEQYMHSRDKFHLSTFYMGKYMEGMDKRHQGVRFPDDE